MCESLTDILLRAFCVYVSSHKYFYFGFLCLRLTHRHSYYGLPVSTTPSKLSYFVLLVCTTHSQAYGLLMYITNSQTFLIRATSGQLNHRHFYNGLPVCATHKHFYNGLPVCATYSQTFLHWTSCVCDSFTNIFTMDFLCVRLIHRHFYYGLPICAITHRHSDSRLPVCTANSKIFLPRASCVWHSQKKIRKIDGVFVLRRSEK